jgi:ATP-dependent exoDNAse (exonuclease V) beta subunit
MTNLVLSTFHPHERDQHITFQEIGHVYTISTDMRSKYTSVTTWVHSHFPKFDADAIINKMMKGSSWKEGHKYWGLTPDQIKDGWDKNRDNAAGAGTSIHYEIECFMNHSELPKNYTHKELYDNYMSKNINKNKNNAPEWEYFLNFIKDFPHLKPYRTEWMIYHEEVKLSGSIDMVYENADGTLSIYDWKRTANITKVNPWSKYAIPICICQFPDSNFWHYSLQLNTYKTILEKKYGKKVTKMCLVKLHPTNDVQTYELFDVPILEKEMDELFEERKKTTLLNL